MAQKAIYVKKLKGGTSPDFTELQKSLDNGATVVQISSDGEGFVVILSQ